jgi:hypothetical protein
LEEASMTGTKYLVTGTLRPEQRREDFVARITGHTVSDEAWELMRSGSITAHGYKIGRRPGFIVVMDSESEEAARAAVAKFPLVADGWFDIEVDPISPFVSDIR